MILSTDHGNLSILDKKITGLSVAANTSFSFAIVILIGQWHR